MQGVYAPRRGDMIHCYVGGQLARLPMGAERERNEG